MKRAHPEYSSSESELDETIEVEKESADENGWVGGGRLASAGLGDSARGPGARRRPALTSAHLRQASAPGERPGGAFKPKLPKKSEYG